MKPFLRWAGGKKWLVKHIDSIINLNHFKNYHELFLGGGSIFFHLNHTNQVFLSDLNGDLINTYLQVRDNVEDVINHLNTFTNSEEFYYQIRPIQFNDPIEQAAQFIYLNQTSFNGIYRVNLNGVYNVPYGRRTKDFIQADLLRDASLKLQGVQLATGPFYDFADEITEGDLVFLDPPYTITHNNNGFIKYNEHLFSEEDQRGLSTFIQQIIDAGAYYILTNAAHHDIQTIFHHNPPITLSRASLIGGKQAKRGRYEEFLFTNIENEFIEANRY
ncbi:DNA adenine methylase [Algoriphagus halophilus]|uniref:Site-specific DNA-methyltransferase (adenine-specific) n=1 Tax=Algoriphagus halophilus TaxID=226505 RepID=A0A1N6DUA6_9BACT|nr:Dam family site-specific DNA-(adenine-N6)-methyltransferase [Algoriphagus halophilus]SIN74274.1 DNA adenine methylase [Algoriphagus halophilus]